MTTAQVWHHEGNNIVSASPAHIQHAVQHVEALQAAGETNINAALGKALTILAHVKARGVLARSVQPLVFFLTDGHPTVGETDTVRILGNVRRANRAVRAPVFSLAFGRKTDFQVGRWTAS